MDLTRSAAGWLHQGAGTRTFFPFLYKENADRCNSHSIIGKLLCNFISLAGYYPDNG